MEGERRITAHLVRSLAALDGRLDDFAAALSLFGDTGRRLRAMGGDPRASANHPEHEAFWDDLAELGRWQVVAARDGAMTIFHIAKTMQGIRRSVARHPVLRNGVDHGKLRSANKMFRRAFPSFEGIRHGIAHSAEMDRSPEHHDANAFAGPRPEGWPRAGEHDVVLRTGDLEGARFSLTWEGSVLSYEISGATMAALREIAAEFFGGFPGLGARRAGFKPPRLP